MEVLTPTPPTPSWLGHKLNQEIMKTLKLSLSCATAALFAAAQVVPAQTPPTLGLHLFAGVNISGTVGAVYAVQSNPNIAQTNSWSTIAFVQLPATNYLFVDTTAPANGSRFYRAVLQPPPTNMVFIPPGNFQLGSPTNETFRSADEGPQTTVTISHGFWMGKFEVIQREYLAVTGSNPSQFTGNLSRPVESVSFFDATNYCVLLTQQDLAAGRIPPGTHYRLPTEAEWEYADRAGTSTRFSFGDDLNNTMLPNYAWFSDNSGFVTHLVGLKLPNPWGLYDMAGNVNEWCSDWYGPYTGGFAIDPQGPASNPIGFKVMRGGAWEATNSSCRSAKRQFEGVSPFISDFILGFRVVLSVGQ
jgi:formylglycine-generating enzyme required for sulfatase activity